MKTTPLNQNITQTLDEEIAMLQRRRNILAGLLAKRNEIDGQIEQVMRSTGAVESAYSNKGVSEEPKRRLALPRGVLTIAAFNALKDSKRPMSVEEVTERVKQSPLMSGSVPSDLEKRVKGILYTSEHFKFTGKGTFTNNRPALEGKLFSRLLSQVAA